MSHEGKLDNFKPRWLIPKTLGETPDSAPFLLSEFRNTNDILNMNMSNQEKCFRFSKNEMLKMLWKLVINLGVNPNLNINYEVLTNLLNDNPKLKLQNIAYENYDIRISGYQHRTLDI